MVYTEIKERNGKKYFYRVISLRNGKKVSKKRKYLGVNLSKRNLDILEKDADNKFNINVKMINSIEKIKPKIIKILKKNKVKKAGIFGSYARGEQNKNSDIDIIIEPPRGIGFGFAGIQIELQNELKKKVDLLTYNGIHRLLKNRILGEEVKIL